MRMLLSALFFLASADVAASAITIADAVKRAIAASHDIAIATTGIDEAEQLRKAARSSLGPTLRTEASLFAWDRRFAPNIGLTDALRVRDQVTRALSVSLMQPLTDLFSASHAIRLRASQGKAAEAHREAVRRDVVFQTETLYFRALLASRMVDIAQSAYDLARTHHARAKLFIEAGLVNQKDVLTAEVILARANDSLIRARAEQSSAENALALYVGLRPGETVRLEDGAVRDFPRWPLTLEQSERRAIENRVERRELAHRREMAARTTKLAWGALLPAFSLVATYQHQRGNGLIAEDQFFTGGILSWNFWEWGSGWHKLEATRTDEHRLRHVSEKLEGEIRREVRDAFVAFRSAEESYRVLVVGLPKAVEQLHLSERRFESKATSSSEVLDAQRLLTETRISLEIARLGAFSAMAGLRRAVGDRAPYEAKDERSE